VRDFRDDDLDRAIQVWDQGRSADNASPVFSISEVMAAVRAGQPAVVAVVADELVGVAVAQAHGDRLLVCATNSVHSLDQAFLRPGRFDYVIPVGPPDPAARRAIWTRYLGPVADGVDVAQLVEASDMFTPADIEFAARKGAQAAFDDDIEHHARL
jgi:SpoVK/Ycf46/Vps4 family AAA+-type ATPase